MAVRPSLLRTLPGRAIVVGVAVKLLVFAVRLSGRSVPALVSVIDTVAGMAIAAGAAYFLIQLVLLARRRLLWRVRRKLILSYIFIGFVPAILIVVFFVLFVLLMFFNFSSYLVQTQVRTVEDRVRFLAGSAALEIQRAGGRDVAGILAQKLESVAPQYEGASLAVVAIDKRCNVQGANAPFTGSAVRAGPWAHVSPPAMVPAWI